MAAVAADAGSVLRARLQAALRSFPRVRLALLFGSFARGAAGPDSDVDIAIAAPGVDLLAVAAELSAACDREVDLVSLADPGIPLLEELVRDAEVLHEGEPGLGASWRSTALATLEIDGPWYARMRDAWLARVAREGL
jgi:predicted nucleotidyltransferase